MKPRRGGAWNLNLSSELIYFKRVPTRNVGEMLQNTAQSQSDSERLVGFIIFLLNFGWK